MRYLRWYESLRTKTETGVHIKKVGGGGEKKTKKKEGYNVHEIIDDVPLKATRGSEASIRKKKKRKRKKKKKKNKREDAWGDPYF